MPQTIRFEYKDQEGNPCALIFEAPSYVQRERMIAKLKHARATWENTELAKRLHAVKNGSDIVTDDQYWQCAAGVPESDFEAESRLNLVAIDQALVMIQGWEVNGVKVEKEAEAIRDEIARIRKGSFFYSIMGKAFREIYGDGGTEESS